MQKALSPIDPLSFWKKYSLLNSSDSMYKRDFATKCYCRFCKKDSSGTSFVQITHLLPELLGKNNLHTYDECDSCNSIFSDYESHLSNFARPFITATGISGKGKVPAFQSRSIHGNRQSVTSFKYETTGQRLLTVGKNDDVIIDREKNVMSVLFRHPPYIPSKIYKSLVKIGMSLLPSEFDEHCEHIYKWLLSGNDDISYVKVGFMTMLTDVYWTRPSAELYQANNIQTKGAEYPEYILILKFANQVFQIFLPFTDLMARVHNRKRTLQLELYPPFINSILDSKQKIFQVTPFEFGRNHSVVESRSVDFSFSAIESERTSVQN